VLILKDQKEEIQKLIILEKLKEVTLEENQNLMVGLIVIMITIKSFLVQKIMIENLILK
jgi:hypothetical protein